MRQTNVLQRRPRQGLLPLLITAALLQWAGNPARADSGNGADTVLGNALNPAGINTRRDKDPDGMGESAQSRSPTGLMNATPLLVRDPVKTESGWLTSGSVELGGLSVSGDKSNAKFGEYKSLQSGGYLNSFQIQAEKPTDAFFLDVLGGGLARDDQYFGLTLGKYNAWKVKTFYNEIGHVFTSTYRNLWNGTGTGVLTLNKLPAGPLAPATAATTDIAIGNAALATPYSTLSISRQRGGVRVDMNLPSDMKFFAAYTGEKRAGARPFGMVSGGGGGTGGVEIPETLDYDTHDVVTGVQWSNERSAVNVQASVSMFRNNTGTLTVDNPMFLPAANGIGSFPRSVFDLAPDNDFYNLKAELSHAMPELLRSRFTAVLSSSSSRQNDALIPATSLAGGVVNGVAGGAWDTVASLSKANAGARIDSKLIDLGYSLTPTNGMELKAKLRQYQTTNDTEYWACNPLTGQWGRLVNDGSGGAFATPSVAAGVNPAGTTVTGYDSAKCSIDAVKAKNLVPAAGNVNIRNIPYEYKQTNAGLSADYRLGKSRNLSASYERETMDRAHRERAETWEDKFKIGYVDRSMAGGTLRASVESNRRRGTPYIADPYDEFYSASFGGVPTTSGSAMTGWIHVNELHRKFDLADRDQTALNLRWNHQLREDLDLSLSGQLKDQRYPTSAYGRNGHQRQNSVNMDLNWQASAEMSLYGFIAQQNGRMAQTGIQQNACALGTTYYFFSDGSIATSPTPTAAQTAAGITVVANSGAVTAANFAALCGTASAISPLYPTSRAWTAVQTDSSTSAGVGFRRDFGKVKLDLNYNTTRSRTAIAYTYNAAALGLVTSGAPTAAQLTALALVGNGFPDMVFKQDVVDANLMFTVSKSATLRLQLRHEAGKFRDWHYDGVAANPTPATNMQTYLDSGPQDYRTNMLGAFLQFAW